MSDMQEPEQNENPANVVISSKVSRTRKFPKIPLLAIVIVAIAVLLAAMTFLALRHNTSSKEPYVLTISGSGKQFGLTQSQYAALIKQAGDQKVPADHAKAMIIKAHQYKIAAPGLKVEPSDEEVANAAKAGAGYSGEGSLNEWQRLYGYVSGVEGNTQLAKTGGYIGTFFDYPCDQEYDNIHPDKTAIAARIKAAQTRATEDHDQLVKSGTSTTAIKDKLLKDPAMVGRGGSNLSRTLKITKFGTSFVDGGTLTYREPAYVMKAIEGLGSKPGISAIGQAQGEGVGVTDYFFVNITDIIAANQNIDSDLKQAVASTKVVDHVK